MSNLIERLRAFRKGIETEAADEIESLRAQVADDAAVIGRLNGGEDFQSLMTINNDLRAQLEEEEANAACAWDAWENMKAQLAEEKAKHALTIQHFQAHPGERYWEGRWRDTDAQLASTRKALEAVYAEAEGFPATDGQLDRIQVIVEQALPLTDENEK